MLELPHARVGTRNPERDGAMCYVPEFHRPERGVDDGYWRCCLPGVPEGAYSGVPPGKSNLMVRAKLIKQPFVLRKNRRAGPHLRNCAGGS